MTRFDRSTLPVEFYIYIYIKLLNIVQKRNRIEKHRDKYSRNRQKTFLNVETIKLNLILSYLARETIIYVSLRRQLHRVQKILLSKPRLPIKSLFT